MKFLSFLVVLALSFLVSSCSSENPTLQTNYQIGYGALDVLAEQSRFPEMAVPSEPFEVIVYLKNNAGYELRNVKVTLAGLDKDKVELSSALSEIGSLEGRSTFNPGGETRDIRFNGIVKRLTLAGQDKRKDKYEVLLEYDSIVELSTDVCIKTSLHDVSDAGCSATTTRFDGQGAPIAFTNFNHEGYGTSQRFTFSIANEAQGQARKYTILSAFMGGQPLACNFVDAEIPLYYVLEESKDQQRVDVSCHIDLDLETASYETPLQVKVGYSYEQRIPKEVSIRGQSVQSAVVDERLLG